MKLSKRILSYLAVLAMVATLFSGVIAVSAEADLTALNKVVAQDFSNTEAGTWTPDFNSGNGWATGSMVLNATGIGTGWEGFAFWLSMGCQYGVENFMPYLSDGSGMWGAANGITLVATDGTVTELAPVQAYTAAYTGMRYVIPAGFEGWVYVAKSSIANYLSYGYLSDMTSTTAFASLNVEMSGWVASTMFDNISWLVDAPCTHDWADATCTAPKTCALCGATEGEALGHNYADCVCTVCGAKDLPAMDKTVAQDFSDTDAGNWMPSFNMSNGWATGSVELNPTDIGAEWEGFAFWITLPTYYADGSNAVQVPTDVKPYLVDSTGMMWVPTNGIVLVAADGTVTELAPKNAWSGAYNGAQYDLFDDFEGWIYVPKDGLGQFWGGAVYLPADTSTAVFTNFGIEINGWINTGVVDDISWLTIPAAACEHEYTYPCDAHCALCGELTNPDAAHSIQHVEAVDKTCYENGNIEYWYCADCGTAWADEALTMQTNLMSVVTPMAHAEATHVPAKAATCYENGNIEYWYCADCGQAWLDEACTLNTNLMSVVTPMAHAEATHVEAKDATCYENGNIEYWYCDACGAAWLDEACTLNTNLMSVVTPMLDAVAMIGENKYASLADAFAAAKDGDTIILQSDIETDATYTVADGIAITLNMNGKTITATDKAGAKTNYELFYIRGEMTVIGNGTITLTATTDRNWDALSAIFHNRGGVLTIENGTFTHLGGSDMAYVVDNSGNSYGDAVLTINGGELKSSYIGIRNRMDTYKANGGGNGIPTIYVNGGSIEGYIAIWGQASSAGGKGEVYISNGTLISTGVSSSSGIAFGALYFDTDETATMITEITGGTFSSDVSAYCVDGYACMANEDGTYGVVAHEHNYVDGVCSGCGAKDGWVNGCYYVDGEAVKGLYRIDGDYYYFNTGSGKMMADKTIWVKADNGYGLAAGHYVLGTDGKLQVVKNGWLTNDKGQTFYYVNDERVKGLYEIDGDYYYFNTGSGLLTVNKTIWVAKSNAYGLAAGNYELGADGKLVVPVLNGWVGNYYYVDGEAVKGVYEIDGVYYYFHHASGVLQVSKTVWIKADNAYGLAAGNYELTADGTVVL